MTKISSSEITPYSTYINRRKFIKATSAISIASALSFPANSMHESNNSSYTKFLSDEDELNTYEEITTYNNFYEFGVGKSDPYKNSDKFNTKP